MSAQSENPVHFLRLPQVKQRVGLSRSSIYARIHNGEFPAPISLGGRSVGWLSHEVEDWIDKCVAAARNGGSK
jgi:prophage regulatory protein